MGYFSIILASSSYYSDYSLFINRIPNRQTPYIPSLLPQSTLLIFHSFHPIIIIIPYLTLPSPYKLYSLPIILSQSPTKPLTNPTLQITNFPYPIYSNHTFYPTNPLSFSPHISPHRLINFPSHSHSIIKYYTLIHLKYPLILYCTYLLSILNYTY